MKKSLPVHYAIIQYQPHIQRREVANIGLVMACGPTNEWHGMVCEEHSPAAQRAMMFFNTKPESMAAMLRSVKAGLDFLALKNREEGVAALSIFKSYTQAKEGVVITSPAWAAVTSNPKDAFWAKYGEVVDLA